MTHPFRFGWQAFNAESAADWRDKARRAEALGYSAFMVADHYLGPGPALTATNHPVQNIAAVPAIAVAAEVTSTIKVGARVMCIDYRNPAVLVKEMATLDFFSEGRLEFGIGAGWLQGEYEAMGVPWDSAGIRIDRLGDVVRMAKLLMADGEVNFESEKPTSHVRAVGFEGLPKTIQRPHPPIMIGGGARRVLQLAGREAQIVSLNFDNSSGKIGPGVPTSDAEATAQKIEWIREGAGDRFDELELEIGAYFTFVTDQGQATAEAMAPRFGLSVERLMTHPHALIGSVDEICEQLERRREQYGISYITVGDTAADAFAPVVARLAGK